MTAAAMKGALSLTGQASQGAQRTFLAASLQFMEANSTRDIEKRGHKQETLWISVDVPKTD